MSQKAPKKCFRMTKAERASIERTLDGGSSGRGIARDLGRAASAITEEIKRNRTVCKGPGKGERVAIAPRRGEGLPEARGMAMGVQRMQAPTLPLLV